MKTIIGMKKYRGISFVLVWVILMCGIIPATFAKPAEVLSLKNERRVIDEEINSSDQKASEIVLYTSRVWNRIGCAVSAKAERVAAVRGQGRMGYLFYQAGLFMQERFDYQRMECREDGTIFSNQTMIVDYIRRKDSGTILYS